jgi:uncharacterized membrane protein (UPF0127 family)
VNRTTIDLGGRQLTVYIARKPADWRVGLQNRNMSGVDGMLFVFPHDVELAFDPKGVRVPVLIAFFAGNGGFIDLNYLTPGSGPCRAPRHYRYALELVGKYATPDGAFDLVQPLADGLGALL